MIEHWKNLSKQPIVEEINGIVYIEEWAPINNDLFREGYLVSTFGRIWGLKKNKIRRQHVINGTYLRITLLHNGVWRTYYPHILVAKTHIPNPNNYEIVNHLSGIKTDNRRWFLEWTTQSGNIIHAFESGLSKIGEDHGKSKLTNVQAVEIAKSKEKLRVLSQKFKVSINNVKQIRYGKTWGKITKVNYHKPQNRSRAHLSNNDIIDIFESNEKPQVLANKFGITNQTIWFIKTGKNYTLLTNLLTRGDWRKNKKVG